MPLDTLHQRPMTRSPSTKSGACQQAIMDRPGLRCLWLLLGLLLALRANAACTSYGVDYSSGGSYYIDGASNQYFSFATVFQGKARRAACLGGRGDEIWC